MLIAYVEPHRLLHCYFDRHHDTLPHPLQLLRLNILPPHSHKRTHPVYLGDSGNRMEGCWVGLEICRRIGIMGGENGCGQSANRKERKTTLMGTFERLEASVSTKSQDGVIRVPVLVKNLSPLRLSNLRRKQLRLYRMLLRNIMSEIPCNSATGQDPGNPDITGIGVRSNVYIQSLLVVSALTGSLLVHPTYFNRLSARRQGWNMIAVTIIRVLGGLLPAVVCTFSGGPPNCASFHGQIEEPENFDWIVLFAVHVGQRTAYALILTFAGIVLLLHLFLSLDAVPEAIQHFTRVTTQRLSRFIAVSKRKQRLNDLTFGVFFIYWIEVVVAIEHSLVVNFGSNVRAQNNWGFGQALWWNIISPMLVPANRRMSAGSDPNGLPTSFHPTREDHCGGAEQKEADHFAGVPVIVMMNEIWQSWHCLEYSGILPVIRSAHPSISPNHPFLQPFFQA
ncbi:hypothetical protein PILCRDRAFT_86100 [Piloderma croceum F 1598]|uniref:Uncharacterized protein n=1 Tax=Piloderma croceum (strain F 1598) TaxID=765440 RepID=A0A0C3BKJ6_PILCF|nr:hypothetical protein PILCRDRAFT_86100 [Piloderma croceum F 1598]